MVKFVDKYGYYLHISMVTHDTNKDFTDEFFTTSILKKDENGCYIVADIDNLIERAKDCWASRGYYSGNTPNSFRLRYTSYSRDHKTFWEMLDSDYMVEMGYECCI